MSWVHVPLCAMDEARSQGWEVGRASMRAFMPLLFLRPGHMPLLAHPSYDAASVASNPRLECALPKKPLIL